MVKVAILADSPTLTTGFGRTTQHMADSLAVAGHDVAVFGLKARPADVACAERPYRVWPAEQGGHWTASLGAFFVAAAPDVLVLNMDAYNAHECVDACAAAGWPGPTVSYVCFDGLPLAEPFLEAQRRCDAVWATSNSGAAFLRSRGVDVRGVATPGVDPAKFNPAADRAALRGRAGLGRATLVGAFATNTERKQLARIIDGFGRARLPADARLYLHCRKVGHCDVVAQARDAGMADRLLLPEDVGFEEHRGLAERDYVRRLNVCDVIVNAPHSGDVEQIILEAQACGVPLLHTADDGVMSEALADGGLPLYATTRGIGALGQVLHFVDPATIADALARIVSDESLRERVRQAGLANAARYRWSVLETAARQMVKPFATLESR